MNISPVRLMSYDIGCSHVSKIESNHKAKFSRQKGDVKNAELPDTVSFLGTYYATTDAHSRLPMVASTLSEIENRCNKRENSNEPVFLLDCGDFVGNSYSLESVGDIYTEFQKRNPDITCIFNLGNYDIDPLLNDGALVKQKEEIKETFQKMANNRINIVSASYYEALERYRKNGIDIDEVDFIKPYMLLDDIADGESQTVIVTGIGMNNKAGLKEEKSALDYFENICRKDGIEADKTIILIHDKSVNADELLKYAKKIGIKNVELVIGGHPHCIDDFVQGDTRVLYPPAQGKGAYEIQSTKDGFKFEHLKLKQNKYDYSPLASNLNVIDNSDINKPYPIKEAYQKILSNPINAEYLKKLVDKCPYTLEFRNYDKKNSTPTTFGTFVANNYRDFTGSDIALSRNQFLREKLPSAGKPVSWYNICDSINVDADLYKVEMPVSKLKKILEISLEKQDMGLSNPSFLEYSDNLRITRKENPKEGENIICQIEINENGEWKKLLDKNGMPKEDDRILSVTTEDALACGILAQFSNLNLDAEKIEGLTMRSLLIKALQEAPNSDEPYYYTSKIINI